MSDVELTAEGFVVDAGLLAAAFGLQSSVVQDMMRNGRITSRSERGQGEDEGRWRLTFYYEARALRLTLDADGTVLSKASFPVSGNEAAASSRGG
ncbi:DUF6522 family protein [Paracoccus marinaquae]|uniref:Uncharacterized protein n=1 Tax=Paracoccus marinaquae TaxID=2841926 RepID=A0ABS6ALR4_9RHOB|nr:DUF6522 family protein [Paracoccus marinaquae]MBU3030594.1 hypothetical protein [Paracoccus marinaquae]